jgi:FkbM family methyltransferase
MSIEDEAREAFHPGGWLRLKSLVPGRFSPLLNPIESRLYEARGIPVTLGGRKVRLSRASPFPMTNVYNRMGPEAVEDLAMLSRVLKSLSPGGLFLDVGSHYGIYAVAAANLVGETGRVAAFEPTPESCAQIRHNLAISGFSSRVEVHQVAVSDKVGTVEFSASGESCQNAMASLVTGPRPETAQTIAVPTVALDAFLDDSRPTVAKIDTEGAELLVLRGAPRLLASRARVFVELHPWGWSSESEGWQELQGLAQASGRTVRQLDGRPLERPGHRRIELAG